MLAAPRGFEPRFTDPKSAVLPLDEGAAPRPGQRKWSGRRDSNPRPSPWQGDALPTEPLPPARFRPPNGGAESQNRTGDTAIFSRVLYQLSYLGPMANQALAARRRREDYHAPRSASKPGSGPGRPEPDRWDGRSGQIPMGGHLGRIGLPQGSSERPLLAKKGYRTAARGPSDGPQGPGTWPKVPSVGIWPRDQDLPASFPQGGNMAPPAPAEGRRRRAAVESLP